MKLKLPLAAMVASAASLSAQTFVNPGDLDSAGTVTWDTANDPYILNGTIFVKGGTDLVIEPGVVIRGQGRSGAGEAGAPGSLIVTQTGTIDAQGNSTTPIIFTTAVLDDGTGEPSFTDAVNNYYTQYTGAPGETFLDDTPATDPLDPILPISGVSTDELWGGLVILGEAPTNLGPVGTGDSVAADPIWSGTSQLGHIEGLSKSNDTLYGGPIVNDNSGVIRYVSIRHGGNELGDANEINGLTMGGVGSGTLIEFVEIYMNQDDGFEWFGGTVNASNLITTYAGDDQFDADQGFTGVLQYLFGVLPYFTTGSKNGDKGFEFDGDDGFDAGSNHNVNGSGNRTPFSDYTVYNATILGNQEAAGNSVAANGGMNLKARFGGSIYTSYFVNTSAPSIDSLNATVGATIVQNTFNSPVANFVSDTNTELGKAGVTASGNVVNSGGAFGTNGLVAEDQNWDTGTVNPRPKFALNGVNNSIIEVGAEENTYRGAFNPDANVQLWTTGWTALNTQGVLVD